MRCSWRIGCNASPAFEVEKGVFHQMAQFVEMPVIRPLPCPVLPRWNDRFHALSYRLLDDGIAVVNTFCDQTLGNDPFHHAASLSAIRCGTLCNKNPDRHTMRIHGQMYLGAELPFARPMS